LDEALPVYIANIFRILKLSGSAESDLAQTALKTLAVILRDCKTASVSDHQLKYVLEIITPDLEDADRQGAIFAVIRAIVGRNFVVPEVYDMMDRIFSIMVTSQSTNVQEQCRSVLIQFLLDYPQGAGRLKSQMTFLAQNLDYIYQSGRISVMELLSAVFSKFSDDIVTEYADLFFVALVMVLANDDSEKCRTMAGALVKQLVDRVDDRHRERIVGILKSWVERLAEHVSLGGAALSVFGLLVGGGASGVVDTALEIVAPIVEECASVLASAEDANADIKLDHQLPHQALVTLAKIIRVRDDVTADLPWSGIIDMLLFPHDWVRFDTARVITTVLTKPGGLELFSDDQLLDIARKSCLLLKGGKDADGEEMVVDAKLADEVVKLLWNVAKHWAVSLFVKIETKLIFRRTRILRMTASNHCRGSCRVHLSWPVDSSLIGHPRTLPTSRPSGPAR
jgi:U3 small nucleolar RNA-associated protein 20